MVALAAAACALNLDRVQDPPDSIAVTTTGPWTSMIYLARTDSGVIVIDLGWAGAATELRRGLRELRAAPDDVVAVFLTHSHRDHIAGWPSVRHARFHLGAAEVPLFTGRDAHEGAVPRLVEAVDEAPRPSPGELELRPFTSDTAFVFGDDTVFAYPAPGHTPGSAVYLHRGILFAGDAIAHTPLLGFHEAKRMYSEDAEASAASIAAVWRRIDTTEVRLVCNAHAKCAEPDSAFIAEVTNR